MLRLEKLFGIDRHRLSEALRGVQKRSYTYLAVAKIMDVLLAEKPAKKRKRHGRSPRNPWLNDPDVRTRVLTGFEARINSLSVLEPIKTEFLAVVRRHMPESGKQ
jgi:hypothetical protein